MPSDMGHAGNHLDLIAFRLKASRGSETRSLGVTGASRLKPTDVVTTLSQVVTTTAHNTRHAWTLIRRSPDSMDNRKLPWTRQIDFPS